MTIIRSYATAALMDTGLLCLSILVVFSFAPNSSAAAGQAQDENPILLLRFDEGAGNLAKDSSGNGNNGDIHGASWVEGRHTKGLQFNGIDNYVDCGTKACASVANAITVEAWVKVASDDYSVNMGIVAFNAFPASCLFRTTQGSGRFMFWLETDTGNTGTLGNIVKVGEWEHLVGVYDGANVITYQNGYKQASKPLAGTIKQYDHPVQIGRWRHSEGEYFNGAIDEVRIYNRALSAQEVLAHYQKGTTSACSIHREEANTEQSGGVMMQKDVVPKDINDKPQKSVIGGVFLGFSL